MQGGLYVHPPSDIKSLASLKLYSVRLWRITQLASGVVTESNYNWHEYLLEGAHSYRDYRSQLLEAPLIKARPQNKKFRGRALLQFGIN